MRRKKWTALIKFKNEADRLIYKRTQYLICFNIGEERSDCKVQKLNYQKV